MKKLLSLPLLTFILLLNSSAHTTQRGVGVRIRNERGQVEAIKLYEGSYALVIGAVNYRYWNKLGGVRDDLPAVRAALERHGFKVEGMLDPTGDALLARINKFINDYGLYPENRLLIYFAGHGYTEVSGDGRKFGYVVPIDAPKPSKDLIGFQQKSLTMDELETPARRIRSKHALFVFDSCFSGTLVSRGGLRVPPVIDYYATRPVRQFITAGADNQEVPDESVFRQVFVRGLEGKADQNNDGYVTGTELATYLQEQVLYYRGEAQTPQYGKIRDPRLDSGDFIFMLPGPSAAADTSAQARALAARALTTALRGEADEALRLANQALGADNSLALAYAVRGHALCMQSRRESPDTQSLIEVGLRDLRTANQMDARNGLLRALLSEAYNSAEKHELSKTVAKEAVGMLANPNGETEFYARGLAHLVSEDYDAAIADFDIAIRLNPRHVDAYFRRGLSYFGKSYDGNSDFGRAIIDFGRAIELNPLYTAAYLLRGNSYNNDDDFDRAITDYDKIIQLDPRYTTAYNNRGHAYHKKGDVKQAIADYSKAIQLNPRYATAYSNRGAAYSEKGEYNRAIVYYSEAIRLNPDYIRAYWGRADVYEKAGQAAKAQADRQKAAELEKRGVEP